MHSRQGDWQAEHNLSSSVVAFAKVFYGQLFPKRHTLLYKYKEGTHYVHLFALLTHSEQESIQLLHILFLISVEFLKVFDGQST